MSDGGSTSAPFWETDEAVDRFAAREPDRRLLGLLDDGTAHGRVRALDLGCAAGRNTVVLAEAGFDFFAVDSSAAMVERTRERVATLVGEAEAARRVLHGTMVDLSLFPEGRFDLVLTLGVLHQAKSRGEWEAAVSEVSRVLAPGGLLLHASWSPSARPEGVPLQVVPDEENVFSGFHSGRHYLLEAPEHDEALSRHGLVPAVPTEVVRRPTEKGERVTINGLYRRVRD